MTIYKGVLAFDLDGTLVDSVPGIVQTVNQVLNDFGHEHVAEQAIAAMVGLPLDQFWHDLAQVEPLQWPEYTQRYREIYHAKAIPATTIFPGVREIMRELREAGWRLSIASSKIVPVIELVLQQVEIRELFDLLMGNDVVAVPKPHPEMLLRTMEYFEHTPSTTLMIGDTTHDLVLARNAGVQAVAVTTGSHSREQLQAYEPRAIFDSLEALPQFLIDWAA